MPGKVGRVRRRRAHDAIARRGDRDVARLRRERRARVVGLGRPDGEHARIRRRVVDLIDEPALRVGDAAVPRGRDDEDVLVARVAHRALQRRARLRRAERDVDDPRAVVRRVDDRLRDIRGRAAPGAVERLDRKDPHAERDARDPDRVVAVRADDPGDVRAVRVVVVRLRDAARARRGEEAHTGEQRAEKVGVLRVDAGVDRRDDDARRAPHDVPRPVDAGGADAPLSETDVRVGRVERVVGREVQTHRRVRLDRGDAGLTFERLDRGAIAGARRECDTRDAERRDHGVDRAADGADRRVAQVRRDARRELHEHAGSRERGRLCRVREQRRAPEEHERTGERTPKHSWLPFHFHPRVWRRGPGLSKV